MALSQTIPTSSGLSDLSLCFLTCYNVFGIVVVFSELLFCFLYFAFAFVICYFVFRIVFCFALVGHLTLFIGSSCKSLAVQCSFCLSYSD